MSAAPAPVTELQIPPHSIDAEQSVLGSLLIDNDAFSKVRDILTGDNDFYRDDHRRIFRHIVRTIENGQPADVVTVIESINASEDKDKTGGITYLAALAGNTPSAHNVRRYAEIVRECAERRAIQAAAMELHDRAARGDLKDAKRELAERVEAIRTRGTEWAEVDLRALALREPEAPRHVIPDWLPAGEVTLLAGHGGAGKSLIALHLGACVALGRQWCGIATQRRRVLYLSAEDREDVLHWRLSRIATHLGVPLGDLHDGLCIVDASHIDAELMIEPGQGSEPILTTMYDALRARIEPQTVLILDGASDLYGASEIVRRHVRRYVRALRRLVDAEGAVLLLAHLDKAAARDSTATDRYSGSTAWHNSVRSRWAVGAESDSDALLLTLAKANHARAGAEIRLRWDAAAHLYLADAAPAAGGIVGYAREQRTESTVLDGLRKLQGMGVTTTDGSTSPRFLPRLILDYKLADGAGKADLAAAMRRLMLDGRLRRAQVGLNGSRHPIFGLEVAP